VGAVTQQVRLLLEAQAIPVILRSHEVTSGHQWPPLSPVAIPYCTEMVAQCLRLYHGSKGVVAEPRCRRAW